MGVDLEVKLNAESVPLHRRTLRNDAPSGLNSTDGTGFDSVQIVFLHGFSQTGGCMGPVAELLGSRSGYSEGAIATRGSELHLAVNIVSLDLPGHGQSAGVQCGDLWSAADLVASSMDPAILIGYSMGARVALHVALRYPQSVKALVLIGATAGIEDPHDRESRLNSDQLLASRLETIGVEQFAEEWLQQDLFKHLPDWARFLEERRQNQVAGLGSSLRQCGTGAMDPLWSRLHEIDCPVLVLAGELDHKFRDLGIRIAQEVGDNATFEVIAGAGHSTHLEQPSATSSAITEFIDNVT